MSKNIIKNEDLEILEIDSILTFITTFSYTNVTTGWEKKVKKNNYVHNY